MTKRIYIDVDGVLNAFEPDDSFKRSKITFNSTAYYVNLNPEHGKWLLDLALETDSELVWGTMWEDLANVHIGPVVGLPYLPVMPVKQLQYETPIRSVGQLKAYAVSRYAKSDTFVF